MPIDINILLYAPTADKPTEEVEQYYKLRELMLKTVLKNEICIIIGAFNAKLGRSSMDGIMGRHGLERRNKREEEELVITNTCYNQPPRRLYTWKSLEDDERQIIRNQMNNLLINKIFQYIIKIVAAYPGADIASHYNSLMGNFNFKGKLEQKPKNTILMHLATKKIKTVYTFTKH